MAEETKRGRIKFTYGGLSIFLVGVLLSAPIALAMATFALHLFIKEYSFTQILFPASIIFFPCLGWVWLLLRKFIAWLSFVSLRTRDYIILAISFTLLLSSVYAILDKYEKISFLDSVRTNFPIEISRTEATPLDEDICIAELKDWYGEKIPERAILQPAVSGDWMMNAGGCLFFSSKEKPVGSATFNYIGRAGEPIKILLLTQSQAKSILVRINQENAFQKIIGISEKNYLIVRTALRFNETQIAIWTLVYAAAWSALLVIVLMLGALRLGRAKISLALSFCARGLEYLERRSWIGPALILAIVAFMFWPRGTVAANGAPASTDMAYYLSLAKNLYYGNGYVNPDLSPAIYRGPIFPALLALSYLFFGKSVLSAILVERIFFALTIFAIYVLGKKLFNSETGFYAAVLALSVGVFDRVFYFVWTDGPLLCFMLLIQILFWQAYKETSGYKQYVFMGALVGVAYLLKQTVILIAPLPFILWLFSSKYRTWETLKKLGVYAAILSLLVGSWMAYVYLVGGTLNQALGDFQRALSLISRFDNLFRPQLPSAELATASTSVYSTPLPQILATFYNRDIVGLFKIAIFFPLALFFGAYQILRKRNMAYGFLIISILLYSYLLPTQVVANLGFRTNLYFFAAGILLIAAMFTQISGGMSNKRVGRILAFFNICALVVIQTLGGPYQMRKINPIQDARTMDYYKIEYAPMAKWINQNVPPDEAILMAEREGNILHELTDGNRRFEIISTCRGEYNFWPAIPCSKPYISFWIFGGITDSEKPRDILEGISEPIFLEKITKKGATYVIVTRGIFHLYYYLKNHPAFEEVARVETFVVFRVVSPPRPLSTYPNVRWGACLGDGTGEYFKDLKQNDPVRYASRLQDELEPWMGLSEDDVEAFINWQGCHFGNFPGEYRLP